MKGALIASTTGSQKLQTNLRFRVIYDQGVNFPRDCAAIAHKSRVCWRGVQGERGWLHTPAKKSET